MTRKGCLNFRVDGSGPVRDGGIMTSGWMGEGLAEMGAS